MNTCPVLIGRALELGELTSALGQGGVILMSGEAGIGKSRLARAVADVAEEQRRPVLWGRPEVLADPGPFSLVADLLDDGARFTEISSEAQELLRLVDGRHNVPPRQLAARLRGMLASMPMRPLVILEDLQDADEMSLAVLGHWGRAAKDDEVLILGTHRPDSSPALDRILEVFARDRLADSIQLGPLTQDELRQMLRVMWDRDPSDGELREVVRLAEGVPFFAEELAASTGGVVPSSVARAVAARLSRLDPSARKVVEVSSLVIGAIDPYLIAEAVDQSDDALASHLVAAVRAGLLADRDGRLVFRHGIIRQAVADGIVSVERATLHRRLAAAIESRPNSDPTQHAAALARHYAEAGALEVASSYAVEAGRQALGVAALEEATSHFRSALEWTPASRSALEAREGLSDVASRINRRDAAEWQALAVEYEAVGDNAAAARCWRRLGDVERQLRGSEMAEQMYSRARSLLDPTKHAAELAEVLIASATSAQGGADDPARIEALLQDALTFARQCDRHDLAAEALVILGRGHAFAGSLDAALDLGRQGCKEAVEAGNGEVIARAFTQYARTLVSAGRGDEALRALDEADEWARKTVGGGSTAAIEVLRSYAYYATGRPARAEASAVRLGASPAAQDLVALARFYAVQEREGDTQASAYLDAWWDVIGGHPHRLGCMERPAEVLELSPLSLPACIAEMLLAEESDERPRGWWRAVFAAFRDYYSNAAPATRLDVLLALGRAAARLGDEESLEEILADASKSLDMAPYPPYAAMERQLTGYASAASNPGRALEAWREATDAFWAIGNAVESARSATQGVLAVGADFLPRERLQEILLFASTEGATLRHAELEAAMRSSGIRSRAGRPRGRPKAPAGTLSVREEEVAVLVAAGATNAEIARRLVLSERTIEDHISRAQRRLGISGRAGLAAWAAKRGLV